MKILGSFATEIAGPNEFATNNTPNDSINQEPRKIIIFKQWLLKGIDKFTGSFLSKRISVLTVNFITGGDIETKPKIDAAENIRKTIGEMIA